MRRGFRSAANYSGNRLALEERFLWMIAGKVLLFSESAMIRAPNSLIVVRPCQVLVTSDVADLV